MWISLVTIMQLLQIYFIMKLKFMNSKTTQQMNHKFMNSKTTQQMNHKFRELQTTLQMNHKFMNSKLLCKWIINLWTPTLLSKWIINLWTPKLLSKWIINLWTHKRNLNINLGTLKQFANKFCKRVPLYSAKHFWINLNKTWPFLMKITLCLPCFCRE